MDNSWMDLMGEWKKIRQIGESFGGSGVPILNPLELTHTWRKSISKPKQVLKQDLQAAWEKSATAVENRYKLEHYMQHLEVSTQRFPWTQGNNTSINLGQTKYKSYCSNTCSNGLKKKTHHK